MQAVVDPNLPQNPCALMVAGGLSDESKYQLRRFGITLLEPVAECALPESIRTHADLSFHYMGQGRVLLSKNQTILAAQLAALGFQTTMVPPPQAGYPADVGLNIAVCGKTVLYNPKTANQKAIAYYRQSGYNEIRIKQGYTKCAIAVIASDALITEDAGIAAACKKAALDVLLIPPGAVQLRGYPYGFIGGCCGKMAKDILLFNGNIQAHPQYANICSFLREHRVYPEMLNKHPLYDNGGFLPLTEKTEQKAR